MDPFKTFRLFYFDPSGALTLSLPPDKEELVQQLSHNYVAYYDNVSSLLKGFQMQLMNIEDCQIGRDFFEKSLLFWTLFAPLIDPECPIYLE